MTIFGRPRILVIVTLLAGTWLLIAGSIACSETDLEPTLSGQGAAGQETRPSDDWPALQPAPIPFSDTDAVAATARSDL